MTDDAREPETPVDSSDTGADPPDGTPADTDAEGTADDGTVSLSDGLRLRGEVTAVERVPATDVPADFPHPVGTGPAVALDLDLGQYGRSRTYFAPRGADGDDRLVTLLDVHGADDPAALEGTSLLLDVRAGHPVPVLPADSGRGDERAVYGILAGIAPSINIALFTFFGFGDVVLSPVYFGLYIVCTFLVLPVSLYVDALHLRGTTDWEGRPLLWALLSVVPPLYIVVVFLYLLARQNVRPLALERARES